MRLMQGRIGAVAVVVAWAVAVAMSQAAASPAGQADRLGRPGGPGWTKVWTDTFDGAVGSGVDRSAWKYNTGTGVFGTGEIETMTDSPSNVHLDGYGNLDITALGHGQSWTSGRIQTTSSDFGAPAGGGGFPDGVCQCAAPSDQTTSGGTMTVRYVSVYDRVPGTTG
jgi:hypothetical protein